MSETTARPKLRVAMIGAPFEVHEPPELRERLLELARRLERASA